MRRETLYSRSGRTRRESGPEAAPAPAAELIDTPPKRRFASRLPRPQRSWLFAAALLVALGLGLRGAMAPAPRVLTQADIDAAVKHTLLKTPLPSPATKAYETVRPSVVRVRGVGRDEKSDPASSTGTGVVVVETGLILTSLHVVQGAEQIKVTFADGLESDAMIVSVQPQNDLAVLQAKTLPDDLAPATLRGTGDLLPGDTVVAVGFPFSIGPSVSSGVVSGLRRAYHAPDGKTMLTNLIQFDAAANPGSSGGPLVNAEGEVIGIVTGILNPNEQRVFIGIGFAVPIESAAAALGLPPF